MQPPLRVWREARRPHSTHPDNTVRHLSWENNGVLAYDLKDLIPQEGSAGRSGRIAGTTVPTELRTRGCGASLWPGKRTVQ